MPYSIFEKNKQNDWDKTLQNLAHLTKHIRHQSKVDQFVLSRLALQQNLLNEGLILEIDNLELIDHTQFKNYPDFICSLSHTKNTGAAMTERLSDFSSIGFDIELKSRHFNKDISKKIKNEWDEYDDLELWCAKEATYKCLSNFLKVNISSHPFSRFVIQKSSWKSLIHNLSGPLKLSEENGLIIAQAWFKN